MSGALDDDARELAFELLAEFGKPCSFNKVAAGAYDPDTGTVATTPASYAINLYLEDPNAQDMADGQVLSTDEIAIFPAQGLAIEPAPNDTITIDGKDRVVKLVDRIWSGAQVAVWRCVLKS